ncbi:MAG: DUF87 domain-containing protein [Solirubrobacteraceae bacterium]
MELFPRDRIAGIFRGFSGTGLEFHADLTLPYRSDMNTVPTHGQFVLVELAESAEAVLGRITAISSQGRLASPAGEDYGLRAVEEDRTVPDDLRKQYLKYRVDIRLLGVLRVSNDELVFSPSHRRLPHVGSRVAFLSDDVLSRVAGGTQEGSDLGFFALGEFVYCGDDKRIERQRWMVPSKPRIPVRFAVSQLVARRSFVFARAGFGKSNLIKLLFANLYSDSPTVRLRMGRDVPVGTVIFDPDGEYYWPDANGRPALCDVEGLEDQIVVFTSKAPPSEFYGSFVGGRVKLDIRQLPAALVLSIALSAERQDQQNVRKLKGLRGQDWRDVVDEVYRNGNSADEQILREKLGLNPQQDAEMLAARANMTQVVQMLHDPSSSMLASLVQALQAGKVCVVDISQMRGSAGLALSGIVLRHIFDRNQEEFTKSDPQPIPTIAVVEEAQSVLGGGSGDDAYEAWVKEGRKYNLGAVLVTQQPGSIPGELLSQGDNWFIFHLLSSGDLRAVKAANAHFSDDLLSSLLNEPLPGNGVFWSSVAGATDQAGNAYPIPLRVLSFDAAFQARDLDGTMGPVETYAATLAAGKAEGVRKASERVRASETGTQTSSVEQAEEREAQSPAGSPGDPAVDDEGEVDVDELYRRAAIEHFRDDDNVQRWFRGQGQAAPWMAVQASLQASLPEGAVADPSQWAFELVPAALDAVFGGGAWDRVKRPKKDDPSRNVTWIILGA